MPNVRVRRRLLFSGGGSWLQRNSVAAWKASRYDGSSGYLRELFNRTAFKAQLGSTAGADSNDPLFLHFEGTKYLYLPGAIVNYASTPDAAALDIVGDIDLRCALAMGDWTPAADSSILGKWTVTGNQRSYLMQVNTAGRLLLFTSETGIISSLKTSTVAPTVADGALLLIRATFDVDNGAIGNDTRFYTKTSTPASAYADTLSDAGWTQLGTTITTELTTSIFSGTSDVRVGLHEASAPTAGKFYAAIIKDGIDGTTVFAADFTDTPVEPYATFTEKSSNAATVTINRAATGRKSSMVDRRLFLLGTDDYFEVPDHASLDFGTGDSFTVVVVGRRYGTSSGTEVMVAKKNTIGSNEAGYALSFPSSLALEARIGDGAASVTDAGAAVTVGQLFSVSLVRNVGADTLEAVLESTFATATSDTTTASLANANVLRIGASSNATPAGFGHFEFVAAAVFRKALSAAELAQAITELRAS